MLVTVSPDGRSAGPVVETNRDEPGATLLTSAETARACASSRPKARWLPESVTSARFAPCSLITYPAGALRYLCETSVLSDADRAAFF